MRIDFDKGNGLVPAIIQDALNGRVLMLGYMNREALSKTEREGRVTFYSRSKKRLWTKGETSGNFLTVREIVADCDGDTLLIKARPAGPVCHTGNDTCFNEHSAKGFLYKLQDIIADRKKKPSAQSYTSALFEKGVNKIAQKVGEEATELIIEAMDNNDALFKNETADLLFHLLVLLQQRGVQLEEIEEILAQRHAGSAQKK
ncbi:MAG TPA: bifunctional phosphoribosyl-AMP cyclohydrolase/phosphoribosyl-ATP diphosphatase HisIE [Caldithrix abyssi]|uniref:Histidine biosynthesis bifunctional protein HisIE n=1 Tax=Caldithrix abyssi TaxID=187145 RepID=A0A7V5VFU8_CALAY|nr:bifunctional phosphoribosyl-AMP cyclohydrolase/phosphoribosyl-ATP diphosphatase HisIE [Caldithrix abyssi]